jgi:5-carboxyvanillate decarboxylase
MAMSSIYGTPLPDSLTMSTPPARIGSQEPRHFTSSRSAGASQLTVEDRMSTDEGRERASAKSSGTARQYRRIAVEEAFLPPELMKLYLRMIADGTADDPGFVSLWGFYGGEEGARTTRVLQRIQNLGQQRIADMDATGIDMQILSLSCPGVQIFDAPTATALAHSSNDFLAAAIRKYPTRFAGLAAVAPQDPAAAARELARGVQELGLKGAIVNSHTHDEYLDLPKFWEIFEAAESLGVPLYLHPNTPSRQLIQPLLERGLEGAIFGFAVETGLHLLRIITSGVFDRFPKLQIVVGHLGEALPFWLFRIDFMHRRAVAGHRYPTLRKLERTPSEYLRSNVCVTTSGMAWEPAILFAHSVLGPDRLMYAMDYPYQYVPEEVAVTDHLPISLEDIRKLYQLNAERVFRLNEK